MKINPKDKIPLQESSGRTNVTLIKCPVYIRETIEEMRLLLPDLEKIVLMSDHRYVSAQVRCQMRKVCEQYFPDLEVAYFTEGEYSLDQVLDSIESFDIQKVGLLYYSWFQRKNLAGNKYLTSNNHKTICSFDNHPIFTLEDVGMADGEMAGGYFYRGKDFAHTVMRTLRDVLNGKDPKTIPVQIAGKPECYLSYPILQKAGIPESLYPDDANYLFAPESFWEKTRYMWIVIVVLLFITYIMWARVRLLKKEKMMRGREMILLQKYKTLFNNMPLAYMKHRLLYNAKGDIVDYRIEEVNPMFEEYFVEASRVVGKKGSELKDDNKSGEFCSCYIKRCLRNKIFHDRIFL